MLPPKICIGFQPETIYSNISRLTLGYEYNQVSGKPQLIYNIE